MESSPRKRKRSRWFFEWMLFFLIAGLVFAWQCYSRPIYIYLQTVTVVGNQKITTEEILDLIDRVQQTKQAAASNEFMDDLAESRLIVSLLGSGIVNNTKSRPFLLRIQAVLKDYLEYADQPFQTYETMDEIRRAEQEYAEICSDMKVRKAPETEAARKA